jgi:hypothetical protein
MGRIEWFRRWRYDENTWLAEDQELLQRSYRISRFANLPQIVLGYREERITLGGLSKLLHLQNVCAQLGRRAWRNSLRLVTPAERSGASRSLVWSGGEPRMDDQAVHATPAVEAADWRNLWTLLAFWYGRPCSETFQPSSLLQQARSRQWPA